MAGRGLCVGQSGCRLIGRVGDQAQAGNGADLGEVTEEIHDTDKELSAQGFPVSPTAAYDANPSGAYSAGATFTLGATGGIPIGQQYQTANCPTPDCINATAVDAVFTELIPITSANQLVNIQASLTLSSAEGGTSDFSHTAAFGITLPPGYSFTSASGVFLTQPLAAVPEPQTWLLLAVGLMLLGAGARQRARSP